MNEQASEDYYLSHKSEILTQFYTHAQAWKPFLAASYGDEFAEAVFQDAREQDEFLPFYCYLDFVTHRTTGWGFARTMTLAEGHDRCDFRWKKGGETQKEWPPPFLKEKRD